MSAPLRRAANPAEALRPSATRAMSDNGFDRKEKPRRDQSTLEPQVRFATVPVIAPARSDARNAAVSATSASVGKRLRRVNPSRRSRKLSRFHLGEFRIDREGIAYPMRPETNDTDALRAKLPGKRARTAPLSLRKRRQSRP